MSDRGERLREMDKKLDNIQGDVNFLATLSKHRRRRDIKDIVHEKFGNSIVKKKLWYYADGDRTISELVEKVGSTQSTVYNYLSEMNYQGLLNKDEVDGKVYYRKAEITTGINIEGDIQDQIDDL